MLIGSEPYLIVGQNECLLIGVVFAANRFAHKHDFVEDEHIPVLKPSLFHGPDLQFTVLQQTAVVFEFGVLRHLQVYYRGLDVGYDVERFGVAFHFVDVLSDVDHGLVCLLQALVVVMGVHRALDQLRQEQVVLQYPLHRQRQQVTQLELAVVGLLLALVHCLCDYLVAGAQLVDQLLSLGQVGTVLAVDDELVLELDERVADLEVVTVGRRLAEARTRVHAVHAGTVARSGGRWPGAGLTVVAQVGVEARVHVTQVLDVHEDCLAVIGPHYLAEGLQEVCHNHVERFAVVLLGLDQLLDTVVPFLAGLERDRAQTLVPVAAQPQRHVTQVFVDLFLVSAPAHRMTVASRRVCHRKVQGNHVVFFRVVVVAVRGHQVVIGGAHRLFVVVLGH